MTTGYVDLPAEDGITSINSDTNPAQTIAGGTGITVVTSAGTTTITNSSPASGVSIGALDAQAENANGLALVSNVLSSQSADATHPGMVNITTQSFAGKKTFTGEVVVGTRITAGVSALVDGSTPALDASLGNTFALTTTTAPTIAVPSNAVSGQKITIAFTASGGARTLALNTGAGGFSFGTDITSLTSTTSGKTDYVGCIYNGTTSFWNVVAYVKGF